MNTDVSKLALVAALLLGAGCRVASTTGSMIVSDWSGHHQVLQYKGNIRAPVAPVSGRVVCWADLGAQWAQTVWRQPGLWVPSRLRGCSAVAATAPKGRSDDGPGRTAKRPPRRR